MNQTTKALIFGALLFLLGGGFVYALTTNSRTVQVEVAVSPSPQSSPQVVMASPTVSPTMVASPAPSVAPEVQATGKIVGTLGYPSEGIPALDIYAFKQGDLSVFYKTTTQRNQSTFIIGGVVPGTYLLVAYPQSTPQSAGGYTKAVPCGLSVECTDHSLIPVTVEAGKAVGGVEIKDWYVPDGTFPAKPE